jgi:hypothetical protein
MTHFHKFHDTTQAAPNSRNENASFERLATDPVPVSAGRIWFNTTDKALKYSSLDTNGAVVVRTISSVEDMQATISTFQTALSNEVSRAQSAESTLTTNLSAEVARAQAADAALEAEAQVRAAADSQLTSDLAVEVSRATNAEAQLQTALSSEVSRATNAEAQLQTALSSEVSRATNAEAVETQARIDADTAAAAAAANQLATEAATRQAGDTRLDGRIDTVQAELDCTQAGTGLNADGTFTAPENTTYLGEVVTLKAAGAALDKAITTEVSRAQAAEAALSSALAAEAQLRTDGDNALQEQIEAWVKTQIALGGTTDENRVAAEAALRIAKDDALQAELDRTQAAVGLDTDGNLTPITGTNYLDGVASVFAGVNALDVQLKVVTDGLAGEALARQTTDQDFLNHLQAETIARTSGDVAILQGIDFMRAGAGLEADGSYAAPTGSNYLNSATSLKGADYILDAAIKVNADAIAAESAARDAADANEASLRTAADTALDSRVAIVEGQVNGKIGDLSTLVTIDKSTLIAAINEVSSSAAAETTRATAAEAALTSDLATEASRAQAAEATLTSNLATEAAARLAAEATLTSDLATEASRAQAAEATLTSNLATEASRAQAAEAALKSTINAQQFTYISDTANLSHTINHGLNSEHILFNIMVEGADGKFRTDTVSVEELDFNSFRIELTEAHRVKVAVCAMTALS